jgi:hypothetical protein
MEDLRSLAHAHVFQADFGNPSRVDIVFEVGLVFSRNSKAVRRAKS